MKTSKILTLLMISLFSALIFETAAQPNQPPPRKEKSRHHAGKQPHQHFWESLPEAERARFQKLYREDPAAFHAEVRAYWKKVFEKQKQEVMEIGKRYHAAKDDAEKKKIENELRAKITGSLDKHLQFTEKQIKSHEKRIQHMQKRLEHLKAQLELKKKNKNADIEKTVKKILDAAKPSTATE